MAVGETAVVVYGQTSSLGAVSEAALDLRRLRSLSLLSPRLAELLSLRSRREEDRLFSGVLTSARAGGEAAIGGGSICECERSARADAGGEATASVPDAAGGGSIWKLTRSSTTPPRKAGSVTAVAAELEYNAPMP